MPISFDQLWNKCESLHQNSDETLHQILEELTMKVSLYQALADKNTLPSEEIQTIKSRTIGEILLTLTKLSLKDNLNVYEALNIAMQHRSIEVFSKKY